MSTSHLLSTLSVRKFTPTAADKAQRAWQLKEYVKELWILIASVIALLTVARFVRFLVSSLSNARSSEATLSIQEKKAFSEGVQPGSNGKISWRRAPVAVASAFRITAFRLDIPVGPSSKASIAELLFIFGYISATFVWLFVNSRPNSIAFRRNFFTHASISTWFDSLVLQR